MPPSTNLAHVCHLSPEWVKMCRHFTMPLTQKGKAWSGLNQGWDGCCTGLREFGADTHSYSHLFNMEQNETHSKQHLLKPWIQTKIPQAQAPARLSAIKAWAQGCPMAHRDVTALCSTQGRLSLASCTTSGPSHHNSSSLLPGATGISSDITDSAGNYSSWNAEACWCFSKFKLPDGLILIPKDTRRPEFKSCAVLYYKGNTPNMQLF